jgi:hypothetical protein
MKLSVCADRHTSHAPPQSTPTPPSAAHVMPEANHPTRQHDSPWNTTDAHRLQLCSEFLAQDTSQLRSEFVVARSSSRRSMNSCLRSTISGLPMVE